MGKCLDICPRKEDLMQNHNRVIHIFQKHLHTGQVYSPKHFQSEIINTCVTFEIKKLKWVRQVDFLNKPISKIGIVFHFDDTT